jgi:tetratricopeptide (TPR) repeat protein
MSLERDEGFAALQRGDIAAAVEQLEIACQQTPDDYYAHMYLGAAYGQAEQHSNAVTVLTRAVELEPANAQARYNLGIALERAGWPQEALTAFQQALTLQPDYPKAQEAVGRLQSDLPSLTADFTIDPLATRTMQLSSENLPRYTEPTILGEALPIQPALPPPGFPYGTYPPASTFYTDRFSVKEALRDWIAVLKSPQEFFRNQVGREGFNAPLAMTITYLLVPSLAGLFASLLLLFSTPIIVPIFLFFIVFYGAMLVGSALMEHFVASGIFHLVGRLFGNRSAYNATLRAYTYSRAPLYASYVVGAILFPFVLAPFIQQGMEESRRKEELQSSRTGSVPEPSNPFTAPASPGAVPGSTGESQVYRSQEPEISPLAMAGIGIGFLAFCIGVLWSLILLGVGIAHLQRLNTGAAVGTVLLGTFGPLLILGSCFALVFFALASLAVGAGGR